MTVLFGELLGSSCLWVESSRKFRDKRVGERGT